MVSWFDAAIVPARARKGSAGLSELCMHLSLLSDLSLIEPLQVVFRLYLL